MTAINSFILISKNEQVFFSSNYQERINSPIITTGNELVKEQIADFSKQLNMKELYSYIFEVGAECGSCRKAGTAYGGKNESEFIRTNQL